MFCYSLYGAQVICTLYTPDQHHSVCIIFSKYNEENAAHDDDDDAVIYLQIK